MIFRRIGGRIVPLAHKQSSMATKITMASVLSSVNRFGKVIKSQNVFKAWSKPIVLKSLK